MRDLLVWHHAGQPTFKPLFKKPRCRGSRWIAGGAKFLFPVRALSKKFCGAFLARFDALLRGRKLRLPAEYTVGAKQPRDMLRSVRTKPWMIYSKPPFVGLKNCGITSADIPIVSRYRTIGSWRARRAKSRSRIVTERTGIA
jgi:hypothetical protein